MDPNLEIKATITPEMRNIIKEFATIRKGPTTAFEFLQNRCRWGSVDKREVTRIYSKFVSPTEEDGGSEAQQLLNILSGKQYTEKSDSGWFYKHEVDGDNRLTRIFWMSPEQRKLYRQYCDMVVADTTFKTNRFNMALHCFVVVDSEFKTRLVATALTAQETEADNIWILSQLEVACEKLPDVLMVDNDAAMDAASANYATSTHVINCIWHINNNLKSKLNSRLGKEGMRKFREKFYNIRDTITPTEFQLLWDSLLQDVRRGFSDCDDENAIDEHNRASTFNVLEYLQRLYARRVHWGGPWVRTIFTAGMRSTQRVEKTHHLVKVALNNRKSLRELFESIESVVSNQHFKATDMDASSRKKSNRPLVAGSVKRTYRKIIKINEKYLSIYAQQQMIEEMDFALSCHGSISSYDELQRDYLPVAGNNIVSVMSFSINSRHNMGDINRLLKIGPTH